MKRSRDDDGYASKGILTSALLPGVAAAIAATMHSVAPLAQDFK
jgi:hypothetical protein